MMRSMTRHGWMILAIATGTLTTTPYGARPVGAETGGRILTACVGPSDVDSAGVGQAFPLDPVSCNVSVRNAAPMDGALCLTSVVNWILGEGAACDGDACRCVGGDAPGRSCSAQDDCTPRTGAERGVCVRRGTPNLLPGGAFRCAGSGDSAVDGKSCDPEGPPSCGAGVCCVLLDAEDTTLSVSHPERVRVADNRPLLVETLATGFDLEGKHPFTLRFQIPIDVEDLHCGDRIASPCRVAILGDVEKRVFCEAPGEGCTDVDAPGGERALQRAVDAAVDGTASAATVISVAGRCHGPVRVYKREHLTIRGVLPEGSAACQDGRVVLPEDLRSTVAGMCSRSEGDCETLKIYKSSHIRVEYLNVVNGMQSGLEFRRSSDGAVFCSCMARNLEEGLEFDKGEKHLAEQNLVAENGALEDGGIRVHDSTGNVLRNNLVVGNKTSGIRLDDEADGNIVEHNVIRDNIGYGIRMAESENGLLEFNDIQNSTKDGIYVKESDHAVVRRNDVSGSLGNAVRLKKSDDNVIDGNTFTANAVDAVVCESGSDDNSGSDVAGNPDCE